eukprot:2540574-Karenia_brevis.AAC.1
MLKTCQNASGGNGMPSGGPPGIIGSQSNSDNTDPRMAKLESVVDKLATTLEKSGSASAQP